MFVKYFNVMVMIAFVISGQIRLFGNPILFFDESDLPELRQRTESPDCKDQFAAVLSSARAYCDRQSAEYVGDDKIDALVIKDPSTPGSHGTIRDFAKWMEAIGFSYQITGEEDLARNGIRILEQVTQQYPVTHPVLSYLFAGGRGDMMRGLAIGYDWLSPAMTEEQKKAIAEVCAGYVKHTIKDGQNPQMWWYKYHNFNGVAGGAAGALAVAIADMYPKESKIWIRDCTEIMERWLNEGFDSKGAYLEGISYSNYGLYNGLMFVEALKRIGGKDLYEQTNLKKVGYFYAMSLLPGEAVGDARNDSNYDGPRLTQLLLAKRYNDGLNKWLWEYCGGGYPVWSIIWHNDVKALSPKAAGLPLAEHFPDRGLCIWRSGWDKEDWMFSIEAGPYYAVIHDQADEGHFTFYGGGCRWAIDNAYANNKEPQGRAQTVAHNCILINGKGQALSGAGLGNNGKIVDYYNDDVYGYSLADCTEGYRTNNEGDVGVELERAIRRTLFVRSDDAVDVPYSVVADDIQENQNEQLYTWQMYTQTGMEVDVDEHNNLFVIKPAAASGGSYIGSDKGIKPEGKCVIKFNITKAGEYYVWGRVLSKDESENSFKVRVNNSAIHHWHFKTTGGIWKWEPINANANDSALKFNLRKGANSIEISVRELGAKVDQIFITSMSDWGKNNLDTSDGILLEAEKGILTESMKVFKSQDTDTKMLVKVFAEAPIKIYSQRGQFPDKGNLDYLRIRAESKAVNPHFVAVLVPVINSQTPNVELQNMVGANELTLKWKNRTDTIIIPKSGIDMPKIKLKHN